MNKHLAKEDIWIADKHMERYTSSFIWEIQIKTTVSYHKTNTRLATIKKTDNNKCWWKYVEVETSDIPCENVKCYLATLENLAIPQNVKYPVTEWLNNSISKCIPKRF